MGSAHVELARLCLLVRQPERARRVLDYAGALPCPRCVYAPGLLGCTAHGPFVQCAARRGLADARVSDDGMGAFQPPPLLLLLLCYLRHANRLAQGDLPRAAHALDVAVKLMPRDPRTHVLRSHALFRHAQRKVRHLCSAHSRDSLGLTPAPASACQCSRLAGRGAGTHAGSEPSGPKQPTAQTRRLVFAARPSAAHAAAVGAGYGRSA